MNETADLPERRPMPEGLRDRLWADIEPQLAGSDHRFRKFRAPLAVAAAVIALAVGVVFALPALRDRDTVAAAGSPGDMAMVNDCIDSSYETMPSGRWSLGARLDLDSSHGFVVIRSDEYAAICILTDGHPTGIMGGVSTRHTYGNLTPARPWDYLSSDNFPTESIHFGIAANNVAALSMVGPDQSVTPTILKNGTFVVRTRFAESSGQYTSNRVKATLDSGQEIDGPFRA